MRRSMSTSRANDGTGESIRTMLLVGPAASSLSGVTCSGSATVWAGSRSTTVNSGAEAVSVASPLALPKTSSSSTAGPGWFARAASAARAASWAARDAADRASPPHHATVWRGAAPRRATAQRDATLLHVAAARGARHRPGVPLQRRAERPPPPRPRRSRARPPLRHARRRRLDPRRPLAPPLARRASPLPRRVPPPPRAGSPRLALPRRRGLPPAPRAWPPVQRELLRPRVRPRANAPRRLAAERGAALGRPCA